jgi:hypothetical protein
MKPVSKTAYYTAGTAKQLLKKGVITKQGGVIGLGKTQKLSENFKNELLNVQFVLRNEIGFFNAKDTSS